MKALLISIGACAALAGCAGYGDPYVGATTYGYPGYYGSSVYSTTPYYQQRGMVYSPYDAARRDRDGDGIPNRADPDRDNDGVPNAWDRAPANPRRY